MLRKMEHFASLSPISPVDPIPWASPRRGGEATVKKKRELFPGLTPASRSSFTSPYVKNILVLAEEY